MNFASRLLPLACAATLAFAPAARAESSASFVYTGAPQSFLVPQGVSSLWVEMRGASGGDAAHPLYGGWVGGNPGLTTATLQVTPGETLEIFVGGRGENGHLPSSGSTTPSAGGFNGGGIGVNDGVGTAGGGGGATDLRRAGERLLVAGGGGGAAFSLSGTDTNGGEGGGLEGGGPRGGTQTAGSAAGAVYTGMAAAGGGGGYFTGGGGSPAFSFNSGSGGSGHVQPGPGVSDAGTYAGGTWDSPYFGTGGDGMVVLLYTVSAVPEPAVWMSLLAGLALLVGRRRR